ncbi:Protein SPA2 [Cytospora mali]|uniref:Protein SPA2 n=1 Tax=Cytospora mali TaxID=578113 RepID=A0A194UWH6_CYTMA|nr:Protein SPA2 [Valsa mali var. pyri (nom. inval.)]
MALRISASFYEVDEALLTESFSGESQQEAAVDAVEREPEPQARPTCWHRATPNPRSETSSAFPSTGAVVGNWVDGRLEKDTDPVRVDQNDTEELLRERYYILENYLGTSPYGMHVGASSGHALAKIRRLTSSQLFEFSTDILDELYRREPSIQDPSQVPQPDAARPPFLEPQGHFHPKRNEARQNLSSLGPARFHDFVNDLYNELVSRHPRSLVNDISA